MGSAKPSVKTITLKRLLVLAFLLVVAFTVSLGYSFQRLVVDAMIDKGGTLARVLEISLASHMEAAAIDQKDLYLQKIRTVVGLSDLRLIRSEAVSRQFALPSHAAERADPTIAQVFASGEPRFVPPALRGDDIFLRVVYPYRADTTEQIACLGCHDAAPDAVLGAVDFRVDMSEYLSISLNFLHVFSAAFLLVLAGIVLTFFRVIDRHIKAPLEDLIRNTKDAYASHIAIDIERYESMELAYVATKVNEFTSDILDVQAELEDKNRMLTALNEEIEATQREVVHTLSDVIESRSKDTANHVRRVAEYCLLLAQRLGLDDQQCDLLHDAAAMHDLGKVGVPDHILNKPGRLDDEEYRLMTRHCAIGHDILKRSERPLLQAAAIIAHQHHEKWDGSGYPLGLAGPDIHIFGRISAVADVFDALSTARCYKAAWPLDTVFAFFAEQRGKAFDPELVDVLIGCRGEMEAIRDRLAPVAMVQ